jgi:hypothetical protein
MSEASESAFTLIEDGPAPLEFRLRDSDVTVAGGYVRHAIDSQSRRHLLVPLAADQPSIEDHGSSGVSLSGKDLEDNKGRARYIDVACEQAELRDLFSIFCDDLLDRLPGEPAAPAAVCASELDRWRELFNPKHSRLLGEESLVGLLAELHVLEQIANRAHGAVIRLWTGPDKARADFAGNQAALEVKATTNRERATVTIHGLQQLDQASLDDVYLYVEQFERVPSGGDSVPDAVGRLVSMGVARADLLRGLSALGYSEVDRDAYRLFRFELIAARTFRASDPGFPRLITASLADPSLAQRIHQVRYAIDVSDAGAIPGHLPSIDPALDHLLRGSQHDPA